MAAKHTFTATRADTYIHAYVLVQRVKRLTWHSFADEQRANEVCAQINATGRMPEWMDGGQVYFPKLRVFGSPEQFKHYDAMELAA